MSRYYKLDKQGNPVPCNIFEFGEMFEDASKRVVARTTVGDVDVSTVFLGIGHSFGDGPPVLWETMIFG